MTSELIPTSGDIRPHGHLKMGRFTQHFVDVLDLEQTPLEFFETLYPTDTLLDQRKYLGRFGVSGKMQMRKMSELSDGQKSRVVLAKLGRDVPHILLLDEPTNHLGKSFHSTYCVLMLLCTVLLGPHSCDVPNLTAYFYFVCVDMESIDALAIAVNNFSGGLVLVSHDMRLISQVAKEIWICDKKKIEKYKGDIMNFKMDLRKAQGIGNDGKLTGDASVKANAKPEKPKAKKPVAKLDVIAPKVSEPKITTISEEPPAPIATPPEEKVISSDVSSKLVTESVSETSVEGAPAKKYVPVHLRKKMEAEGTSPSESTPAPPVKKYIPIHLRKKMEAEAAEK